MHIAKMDEKPGEGDSERLGAGPQVGTIEMQETNKRRGIKGEINHLLSISDMPVELFGVERHPHFRKG